MTLARLLQPSVVVIEDVDLIAGDRTQLGTCEEVLLNKLLNEMDGLNEEADILFILTTNRPEALERRWRRGPAGSIKPSSSPCRTATGGQSSCACTRAAWTYQTKLHRPSCARPRR